MKANTKDRQAGSQRRAHRFYPAPRNRNTKRSTQDHKPNQTEPNQTTSSRNIPPWLCERHEAAHHDVPQVLSQHGEVRDVHPGQRFQAQVGQRRLREPHPQAFHERPPVPHRESNHNLCETHNNTYIQAVLEVGQGLREKERGGAHSLVCSWARKPISGGKICPHIPFGSWF